MTPVAGQSSTGQCDYPTIFMEHQREFDFPSRERVAGMKPVVSPAGNCHALARNHVRKVWRRVYRGRLDFRSPAVKLGSPTNKGFPQDLW